MWRKSSYSMSNGDCIEIDDWAKSSYCESSGCVEWRTSSYCSGSDCLETAGDARIVLVRDSQLKGGGENVSPILSFTPSAWSAFIAEVRRTK